METILKLIFLCGIIILAASGCEKENPEAIEVLVELVNERNQVIVSFNEGDSVSFNFYLINSVGREVTYRSPTYELLDYLNIFKQNSDGEYGYIGSPNAIFVYTNDIKKVIDSETKFLGSIPVISDLNWPEMNAGNYYVGDTLNLEIDDDSRQFVSRIYFRIK